jgi:hypothetical protein
MTIKKTTGDVPAFGLITCGVITTRYIGPTDHKPSRVKATAGSGRTITLAWDHALNETENHAAAAAALAGKLIDNTPADLFTLRGGCVHGGGFAFAIQRHA